MTSLGGYFEEIMEQINQACENFEGEEKQWIKDELMAFSGFLDSGYRQGKFPHISQEGCGPKAWKKKINERFRVIHNIFIENGLESPLEDYDGFRKTKHNPDKKKGGKKKKGGRRRI